MTKWENSLPEGVTVEMLDAYARERQNRARRESYARHPERVERQRLTSYTNFLTKHGRIVLDSVPPLPWSDADRAAVLAQAERLAGGVC